MKNLFCALLLIFWGELTFGQPFPEEPEVLGRHPVRAVTFSPDGKWLATGSIDHKIQLWDRESLKNGFNECPFCKL